VVIIAIVIVLLATNVKSLDDQEYSINTLNELCMQKEEIFTSPLAQEASRAFTNWAQTQGSLLDLRNLHDDYTQKIRERYDINPVLVSDINARLQGEQLNCE